MQEKTFVHLSLFRYLFSFFLLIYWFHIACVMVISIEAYANGRFSCSLISSVKWNVNEIRRLKKTCTITTNGAQARTSYSLCKNKSCDHYVTCYRVNCLKNYWSSSVCLNNIFCVKVQRGTQHVLTICVRDYAWTLTNSDSMWNIHDKTFFLCDLNNLFNTFCFAVNLVMTRVIEPFWDKLRTYHQLVFNSTLFLRNLFNMNDDAEIN